MATAQELAPAQAHLPPLNLEETFREHHNLVFRTAYRVTGSKSDAEDVLQTVFLRLLRRDDAAREVEHIESYLHRAAVNTAVDLIRSRERMPRVPLEEVEGELSSNPSFSPDSAQKASEIRDWLRAAVARLHPRTAEMFVLRFFEDKPNGEIANIVGTTQATVAVTLHRTRDRIEREFRAYMGGRS